MIFKRLTGLALALAATFSFVATAPVQAATVSIQVNGQPISFDQPPIERAGRVFVPLRGVFERLGASVVYSNGLINAQGNGRNISLRIGSQQATVNGQNQYIDVAPFLVGARTLVPLRFVAQALGATVNYNGSNRTVYINNGGGNGNGSYVPPTNASFHLVSEHPAPGGSVGNLHPQITASFSEPVNRDSLRVYINGADVTSSAYTNSGGSGFTVIDPNTLASGTNRVRVVGDTSAGQRFDTGWSFTASDNGTAPNYLRNITPANNTQTSGGFTLRGATRPGATIHVIGEASATAFGVFPISTGSFNQTATADGNGQFSVPISLNKVNGGHIRLVVTSTYNGASVTRTLDYT